MRIRGSVVRAPKPLPILDPSNYDPKNGFPVVKELSFFFFPYPPEDKFEKKKKTTEQIRDEGMRTESENTSKYSGAASVLRFVRPPRPSPKEMPRQL